MRKGWMLACAMAAAWSASAEPMRPFLTRENRQPELFQLEAGVSVEYRELETPFGDDRVWDVTPQFRFGLAPELTLHVAAPYRFLSPAFGASADGVGDLRVGLSLRAWQDIFGFPYLIPFAEATLPTGSENRGLGEGDPSYTFGLAIGTTVYDKLHYALDARYRMQSDVENVASARGALIYDLSKKTSVLVEGEYIERRETEPASRQLVMAGLTYKPTRNWMIGFHGGGYLKEYDDILGAVKLTYSFRPFVF